jgi:hypothetical protein
MHSQVHFDREHALNLLTEGGFGVTQGQQWGRLTGISRLLLL